MTDCDRKGAPIVQPLATATIGGQAFVFTLERHYEGETYSITRISASEAASAVTSDGGGW